MKEIAAKSIIGMPVYSLNDGETLGAVKQLIIDPTQKQLLALAVDKKGWYKDIRIIPAEKIHQIGNDAITISERSAAARAANLPQLVKHMNQANNLIGNRLISDDGQTLGKVEEYYLDAENKLICRLDVVSNRRDEAVSGRASVPGHYIISIGSAAIMIDRAALAEIEPLSAPHKLSTNGVNLAEKLMETTARAKKFGLGKKIELPKITKSSENSETNLAAKLQALSQNIQIKKPQPEQTQAAEPSEESCPSSENSQEPQPKTDQDQA